MFYNTEASWSEVRNVSTAAWDVGNTYTNSLHSALPEGQTSIP